MATPEMPDRLMKETEYYTRLTEIHKAEIAACKESIRQLALVVRDLVYIVRADEPEHDQVLGEHQDLLSEIIGEDLG